MSWTNCLTKRSCWGWRKRERYKSEISFLLFLELLGALHPSHLPSGQPGRLVNLEWAATCCEANISHNNIHRSYSFYQKHLTPFKILTNTHVKRCSAQRHVSSTFSHIRMFQFLWASNPLCLLKDTTLLPQALGHQHMTEGFQDHIRMLAGWPFCGLLKCECTTSNFSAWR